MTCAECNDTGMVRYVNHSDEFLEPCACREPVRAGDCIAGMATLADKSVDVIITDPPYSQYVHGKSRRGGAELVFGGQKNRRANISRARDLGFDAIDPDVMQDAAEQFARIVRRWVLIFTNVENVSAWSDALTAGGLEYVRTGAWVKEGAAPQFTGDRPATAFEAIVIAHPKGKKRWNGGGKHGLWSVPIVLNRDGGNSRLHTTQKPQELMEALVRDFTDPGELICDPFAGSGTTLVAAKRLGRRGIGWELKPEWARIANARIAGTREQLSLLERGA